MIGLKFGIIGNSGGSAIKAAVKCIESAGFKATLVLVTDRPCGLYDWARERGFEAHLIEFQDRISFSNRAANIFRDTQCQDVLMFFTRLVAVRSFDLIRIWNIHPALLPSFPGIGAVKQALATGVKIFGATLHEADEGMDTGPILAQVASVCPSSNDVTDFERTSFLQKTFLTLIWYEKICGNDQRGWGNYRDQESLLLAAPDLSNPSLRQAFKDWLTIQGAVSVKQ